MSLCYNVSLESNVMINVLCKSTISMNILSEVWFLIQVTIQSRYRFNFLVTIEISNKHIIRGRSCSILLFLSG